MEAMDIKNQKLLNDEQFALSQTLRTIRTIERVGKNNAIDAIIKVLSQQPNQELDLENDKYTYASVINYAMVVEGYDFPYIAINKVILDEVSESVIAELDDNTSITLCTLNGESYILNDRVNLNTFYELLNVMRDALQAKIA